MKAIIFCNSRAIVEGLTFELNEKSGYRKYFPHHSNISKDEREYIEKLIKQESDFSVISTSTLELGIDIGDVDLVIQLNNTSSVSSIKQRVGRSGRRSDMSRILQLYSNDIITLLPSIATIELMKEGLVEKPLYSRKTQDFLFHQIILMCIEKNGVSALTIVEDILLNPVFRMLSEHEIISLINFMLDSKYLEFIKGLKQFSVGIEGEKLLKGKEFFSFFETPPAYDVIYDNKKIGSLDVTPMLRFSEGYCFILVGRKWIA